MIDNFTEKLVGFLINIHMLRESSRSNVDFRIRQILFNGIILMSLFALSYLLNCVFQMIIISVIFNIIKIPTFAKHAKTLERCILITVSYITTLSYLSKITINYSIIIFIISLLIGLLVFRYIPNIESMKEYIELTKENLKDSKYYKKLYLIFLVFFIILDFICIILKWNLLSSSISWGIISIWFINTKIYERIIK